MAPIEYRSRPRRAAVVTLLAATGLLAWFGAELLDPNLELTGKGRALSAIPPLVRSGFIWACAAICGVLALLSLKKWMSPEVEVRIDDQGIESTNLWGRGRVPWADIQGIEVKGNWLFVHGARAAGSLKPKKLIIDTKGVDAPDDALMTAIAARRPDLFGQS